MSGKMEIVAFTQTRSMIYVSHLENFNTHLSQLHIGNLILNNIKIIQKFIDWEDDNSIFLTELSKQFQELECITFKEFLNLFGRIT